MQVEIVLLVRQRVWCSRFVAFVVVVFFLFVFFLWELLAVLKAWKALATCDRDALFLHEPLVEQEPVGQLLRQRDQVDVEELNELLVLEPGLDRTREIAVLQVT